jgi:23S rRNA pseudouridine1911/1915/1917 synthase
MLTFKNTTIKINNTQSNQRIDKFLAGFCAKKSRASWQKKIKIGEILVNSKKTKSDYILKENDEIEILENKEKAKIKSKKIPDIKIIYEDDDVIVLDKPAGILSQAASSSKSPNLADFLIKHYPKIKNVGEEGGRCGIAHRLDKDTSGIIITAKNNKSFEFLKSQFKNREVQKTYTALVYGNIKPKEGIIDFKIGRSKTKPDMQTVIDTPKKMDIKSREALTSYKTLKTFDGYSLLEVFPKTGRMHQIRVHLKAIGYPVVGDKKYFFKKYTKIEPRLNRQFLHASELKIKLPNKKEEKFKSDLPQDLKEFLNKLAIIS